MTKIVFRPRHLDVEDYAKTIKRLAKALGINLNRHLHMLAADEFQYRGERRGGWMGVCDIEGLYIYAYDDQWAWQPRGEVIYRKGQRGTAEVVMATMSGSGHIDIWHKLKALEL